MKPTEGANRDPQMRCSCVDWPLAEPKEQVLRIRAEPACFQFTGFCLEERKGPSVFQRAYLGASHRQQERGASC